MISISDSIRKLVLQTPFLEEGLIEGIINLSALARKLKPRIEARLVKNASEGAMVMALKRLAGELQKKRHEQKKLSSYFGDITVRSHICEFTFQKSETFLGRQMKLLKELQQNPDTFITFTGGVQEITVLVSLEMKGLVEKIFREETRISAYDRLSAIIMRLSSDTVLTPGIYYTILKQLAWEEINVVEVVSTYREFIVILQEAQVDRAFSTLKDLIWS